MMLNHFCCSLLVFHRQNYITLSVDFPWLKFPIKIFVSTRHRSQGNLSFLCFVFFLSNLSFDTRLLLFIIKYSFNIFKRQNTIKSSIVLDHKLYGPWDSLIEWTIYTRKKIQSEMSTNIEGNLSKFSFQGYYSGNNTKFVFCELILCNLTKEKDLFSQSTFPSQEWLNFSFQVKHCSPFTWVI